MLSLLNMVYLNSFYFYDQLLESQPLHDITQSMLFDNSNVMQYEIESLLTSFSRSSKPVLLVMLDEFDKLLNERLQSITESVHKFARTHSAGTPISPVLIEYLACCLRSSAESLYSTSRLVYIFIESITTKQRSEYLDVFSAEEFKRLETEFLPRFELACIASFAVYRTLVQPINNLSSEYVSRIPVDLVGIAKLSTSFSVSELVIAEAMPIFEELWEKQMDVR